MKKFTAFLISFLFFQFVYSNGVIGELRKIDPYLNTNPDTAILLSKTLLEASQESSNYFGLVKANLYLGFLHEKNDPGKAVLYYLEGIRHSNSAPIDSVRSDMIWLRRNIANIFRRYESNQLATKYNLEAIELAESFDIAFQKIDLRYNQALVYQNDKDFDFAINYLSEIVNDISDTTYKAEIINQIGLVFLEKKEYEQASEYFNQLLDLPIQAKHFSSKALHNLGEIAYEQDNRIKAIEYLSDAIDMLIDINSSDYYSLFLSYRNIGRYLSEEGNTDEALTYLHKGEAISSFAEHDPSSFELFNILSNVYFNIDNNEMGNHYSQVYFNKMQHFIESQKVIQKKDKEYNFELITKRYFDNVEKQDRMASIMMYSKISTGGLILLLILVVTYYQMEKRRLRKSIERELKSLKVIN